MWGSVIYRYSCYILIKNRYKYMLNVRLAGGHLYGKQLFTWLSLVVSLMAWFVLSFFPLDVWDVIESVFKGFLTYFCSLEKTKLIIIDRGRKENPQKMTQLSSRSHPRHLVGKRTAQKDTIIDITSDSQVNSNFPYRWSPASLTFNNYFSYFYI